MPEPAPVPALRRWMGGAAVVALCVSAAVLYGEIHDQITAHLCVEYFSVAHPRVIQSQDPAVLALVWGVLATWWVGAGLGVALACACWAGRRQPLPIRKIVKPMLVLLASMAVCAAAAGVLGWVLTALWHMPPPGGWGRQIPAEQHAAFSAAAFSHSASYLTGFAGGVALVTYAWVLRKALHPVESGPRGRSYNV